MRFIRRLVTVVTAGTLLVASLVGILRKYFGIHGGATYVFQESPVLSRDGRATPLTQEEFERGLSWWRENWPGETDIHNSMYRELDGLREGTVFGEKWWTKAAEYLWEWRAFRTPIPGFTKRKIWERIESQKDAMNTVYGRDVLPLLQEGGDFLTAPYEKLSNLFRLARTIKNSRSPVSSSKICHFLAPELYIVTDNVALGLPHGYDYEAYFIYAQSCRQLTSQETFSSMKDSLNSMIRMVGEPIERYPYETKITELCLIGRYQMNPAVWGTQTFRPRSSGTGSSRQSSRGEESRILETRQGVHSQTNGKGFRLEGKSLAVEAEHLHTEPTYVMEYPTEEIARNALRPIKPPAKPGMTQVSPSGEQKENVDIEATEGRSGASTALNEGANGFLYSGESVLDLVERVAEEIVRAGATEVEPLKIWSKIRSGLESRDTEMGLNYKDCTYQKIGRNQQDFFILLVNYLVRRIRERKPIGRESWSLRTIPRELEGDLSHYARLAQEQEVVRDLTGVGTLNRILQENGLEPVSQTEFTIGDLRDAMRKTRRMPSDLDRMWVIGSVWSLNDSKAIATSIREVRANQEIRGYLWEQLNLAKDRGFEAYLWSYDGQLDPDWNRPQDVNDVLYAVTTRLLSAATESAKGRCGALTPLFINRSIARLLSQSSDINPEFFLSREGYALFLAVVEEWASQLDVKIRSLGYALEALSSQ
jgi:hypothetical protein